jgi:hypothetical protein
MFDRLECPNPAYTRLVESGIARRIFEQRGEISDLFIQRGYLWSERGVHVINWAARKFEKQIKKIKQKREVAKDILALEGKFEGFERYLSIHEDDAERLFIAHPSFLARVLFGNNVLKFWKYDFPTRRTLEQAIVSFCFGEKDSLYERDCLTWRNGDRKNEVHLNMPGDLFVRQTDVSGGESREENLFGEEVRFDSYKFVEQSGRFGAHQDWSGFLASVLKYAEELGMSKIPEIKDWKAVMDAGGIVGTNTAEAFGGFGGFDTSEMVMMRPLLGGRGSEDIVPLKIYDKSERSFIPYFQEGSLFYLSECENGEVDLSEYGKIFEGRRYKVEVVFGSEDIVPALKANYRFYARDKGDMRRIMERFNGEKVGKG